MTRGRHVLPSTREELSFVSPIVFIPQQRIPPPPRGNTFEYRQSLSGKLIILWLINSYGLVTLWLET